jgi:hypothetical protein
MPVNLNAERSRLYLCLHGAHAHEFWVREPRRKGCIRGADKRRKPLLTGETPERRDSTSTRLARNRVTSRRTGDDRTQFELRRNATS